MFNICFVGGNFDESGGRPSSIVKKFATEIDALDDVKCDVYNGGHYGELASIIAKSDNYDCVLWWANVPNDLPKIRNVKDYNPNVMLITSKRNNGNYSFQELINRALCAKANLCVEFISGNDKYKMKLFDPLGNVWYDGYDVCECAKIITRRAIWLSRITRSRSVCVSGSVDVPNEENFFEVVKRCAERFHELISPAEGITRFLGNSSFRCLRGFPSFKKDNYVFVSRRNVDKRYISKDAFVPTRLVDGMVQYYGEFKPSVDTPIQLRLYEKLPRINYMIHSHVYIDGAPFTESMIPCGGLEEVGEITRCIMKNYGSLDKTKYVINLVGHGSIVMSDNVDGIDVHYVARPLPEYQCK